MSEEGKYYTPSIEEFHVGFEYELLKRKSVYDAEWKFEIIKRVFDVNVVSNSYDWARFNIDLKDKEIRVKYLDADDIESLGWKNGESSSPYYKQELFRIIVNNVGFNDTTIYTLTILKSSKQLSLTIEHHSSWHNSRNEMFIIIKNKSELKKLMNQLGIKNK